MSTLGPNEVSVLTQRVEQPNVMQTSQQKSSSAGALEAGDME